MLTNFKTRLIWGLSVFVIIFFFTSGIFSFGDRLVNKISSQQTATILEANILSDESVLVSKSITLAFVGDIMLDRGVESLVNKNFSGDYSTLFNNVKEQLREYDILIGNLEGPISNKGEDNGGIYSFRMSPEVAKVLKDVGFDILSVANNHTFNWGLTAFTDTLQLLWDVGINYIGGDIDGQSAYQGKIIDQQGVKISFLSFSEFKAGGVTSDSVTPGITIISEKAVKESVSRAKKESDLVVVTYHFGEEYEKQPNTYQIKYAKLAIDAGADLIIGHHPHVVQTLEQYKNVYIMYSLGNFIFDQYFSKETMQGGLLEVEISPIKKRIENVRLRTVFLNKFYQIESIE